MIKALLMEHSNEARPFSPILSQRHRIGRPGCFMKAALEQRDAEVRIFVFRRAARAGSRVLRERRT
jgi:hypothetical protein